MTEIVSPAVPEKLSYHQATELVDRLVEAGMDVAQAKTILGSSGNTRARRMITFDRVGHESSSEQLVRRIMGDGGYFGREEWGDLYGVSLTPQQSKVVAKFPWSEEVLDSPCPFVKGKAISETHFAFLGIARYNGAVKSAHGPLTIMNWQAIHPADGQPRFYNYGANCWYPNEPFAAVPLELRWYLGLKEIVPGSASTSWTNMQGMTPADYYVPSPVMELTKDFLVYQKTKVYPNRKVYAATDTLNAIGSRVVVGNGRDETVDVVYWDGDANGFVGLSLFRK